MEFEFDPAKSKSNLAKRGIDFEEAQKIWSNDNWFELSLPSIEEQRCMVVGMVDGNTGRRSLPIAMAASG